MSYLADTNILTRVLRRSDPNHTHIRSSLRILRQRQEEVFFAPQNLVEFWCVCTRPLVVNGLGLSLAETNRQAKVIERLFTLLPDQPEIHTEWRRLVVDCSVSGVKVHDTRLVAAMRVHGLNHILTLNTTDFTRFPEIVPVHPRDVASIGGEKIQL